MANKKYQIRDILSEERTKKLLRYLNDAPNDLTRAILIGSMIEVLLEQLLMRVVLPGTENDLFNGGNSPLSSFSSRIKMSYALGLISENERKALDQIRSIRNDFAHNEGNYELSVHSVRSMRDKVRNLRDKFPVIKYYEKMNGIEFTSSEKGDPKITSQTLSLASIILMADIQMRIDIASESERPQSPQCTKDKLESAVQVAIQQDFDIEEG